MKQKALNTMLLLLLWFLPAVGAVTCSVVRSHTPRAAPEALYERALQYYHNGRITAARRLLEQQSASTGRDLRSAYLLGRVLFFDNAAEAAQRVLQRALDRHPCHVDTRRFLARIQISLHDFESAEKNLLLLLSQTSEDPDVLMMLARVAAARGKTAAAIELYRRSILFTERLAEAHIELAHMYRAAGLGQRSDEELKLALRLLPADHPLRRPVMSLLQR
ncbi:MAG: hypothetical protein EA384_07635 [Spirochaetaceae bacterium]|nr:MAG: hypothetical protein EA384_07635 [Spirochaetaceae bacterium]